MGMGAGGSTSRSMLNEARGSLCPKSQSPWCAEQHPRSAVSLWAECPTPRNIPGHARSWYGQARPHSWCSPQERMLLHCPEELAEDGGTQLSNFPGGGQGQPKGLLPSGPDSCLSTCSMASCWTPGPPTPLCSSTSGLRTRKMTLGWSASTACVTWRVRAVPAPWVAHPLAGK